MTTSSSYYYSYGTSAATSVEYSSRETASILEAKPPRNTWDDVTKVAWKGFVYSVGAVVETHTGNLYKIINLGSDELLCRAMDGPREGSKSMLSYDSVSPAGRGRKDKPLDPNAAFKMKKRRLF